MTTLEIQAAREACEKATPGPWSTRYEPSGPHGGGDEWHVDSPADCVSCGLSDATEKYSEANAAFIALARTALPAALDRIELLEKLLAEACVLIDELTEDTPDRAHSVRGREIRREAGLP